MVLAVIFLPCGSRTPWPWTHMPRRRCATSAPPWRPRARWRCRGLQATPWRPGDDTRPVAGGRRASDPRHVAVALRLCADFNERPDDPHRGHPRESLCLAGPRDIPAAREPAEHRPRVRVRWAAPGFRHPDQAEKPWQRKLVRGSAPTLRRSSAPGSSPWRAAPRGPTATRASTGWCTSAYALG